MDCLDPLLIVDMLPIPCIFVTGEYYSIVPGSENVFIPLRVFSDGDPNLALGRFLADGGRGLLFLTLMPSAAKSSS